MIGNIRRSVDAMEELFSALLDISRLDAGVVQPHITTIPLAAVFDRVRFEYPQIARQKRLSLRVMKTSVFVKSDPSLLTRLIPAERHDEIFHEFYQLDNPERDRRKAAHSSQTPESSAASHPDLQPAAGARACSLTQTLVSCSPSMGCRTMRDSRRAAKKGRAGPRAWEGGIGRRRRAWRLADTLQMPPSPSVRAVTILQIVKTVAKGAEPGSAWQLRRPGFGTLVRFRSEFVQIRLDLF